MVNSNRWKIINYLGEGGQGKVYRVLDKSKFEVDIDTLNDLSRAVINIAAPIYTSDSMRENCELLFKNIINITKTEDPSYQGALKILHNAEDARDPERGKERIKREILSMSKILHPNLLRILDYDPDSMWFVSQYHPKGTLGDNLNIFKDNLIKSLRAFRYLVEGVSELHKSKIVHRDIKPKNVFINSDNNLVLGDFGLVFFADEQHTRISDTLENVGSRDWMPGWVQGMRIEDIKPAFDVFSLGKLLWSMISGKSFLRLWYFKDPEFNIENIFPNNPLMKLINLLLEKCIVERENNCLVDTNELLEEVDKTLSIIENNFDMINPNIKRRCKVCGIGYYKLIVNNDAVYDIRNFGLNPAGTRSFKIFTCDHCGNVQLFAFGNGQNPNAWQ